MVRATLVSVILLTGPVAWSPGAASPDPLAGAPRVSAPSNAFAGSSPASALTPPGGRGAVAPQSAAAPVKAAEALYAQGNRAAALRAAERIVAGDRFNVEAHHLIQRIYRANQDRPLLLSRYRDLASRYPGRAAAQYLLGNALLSVEGVDAARPHFDRALQLDPGFGWAASINAIFNQLDGNPEEALRLAALSVQDLRDDVLTATIYADLLRMNGLRDEGLRFLEQAAAANPGEPQFLVELWKLRMRGVEDYEVERASFAWEVAANRARFLDSAEHTAMLARFYAGAAVADPDGARDLWLRLADRFPDDPEAKRALMHAAGLSGELDARIGLYNRILEAYPDSPIRYNVYTTMLGDLIRHEEYDRAKRLARGLTSEPDPGRGGDVPGQLEGATDWGYTLAGIGYAAWFAAAQAEAGADGGSTYGLRDLGERDRPISPEALLAARALETSSCNDPRSLHYVGSILFDSPVNRVLGIRLMERAMNAARGGDPLAELAYGADELASAREALERAFRRMPIYYALAGMTADAERAVEQLLDEVVFDGSAASARRAAEAHYTAAYVFDLVGRRRDAARHYLVSQWYTPSLPRGSADGLLDDLARIYEDVAPPAIRRFAPGAGPRSALMSFGLQPVEGATSLDASALGGDLLLMVFWATWNDSSVGQVVALDELGAERREQGLSTLAVAVQRRVGSRPRTAADRFTSFRARNRLALPLARVELGAIERLDLLGVPTTLLLDASGRVLARQLGFNVHPDEWTRQWSDVVDEELARLRAARPRAGR